MMNSENKSKGVVMMRKKKHTGWWIVGIVVVILVAAGLSVGANGGFTRNDEITVGTIGPDVQVRSRALLIP